MLALRRIAHELDAHSHKLASEYNITSPQLLCLYVISKNAPTTLSRLSDQLSLSLSTVNGILDRLETKHLIQRRRAADDRRKILLDMTPLGTAIVANAHKLLHTPFADRLNALPQSRQAEIAGALNTIVQLMALDTLPDR